MAIFPPDVGRNGEQIQPAPHGSSVWMSRNRLFLGGLVSTRARLRFTGWGQYALEGLGRSQRGVDLQRGQLLSDLSGLGVEAHQQLVRYCDAHHFGWFAGSPETLLKSDEIGFMSAHHAADDEQDFPHR